MSSMSSRMKGIIREKGERLSIKGSPSFELHQFTDKTLMWYLILCICNDKLDNIFKLHVTNR